MAAKPIPEGYHSVTAYLIVKDAARALDYYGRAFDAQETLRMPMPDGRIGHAEFKIGDSPVMLADESHEMNVKSPQTLGGAGVHMMIYVANVDAVFKQAIAAGGREMRPLQDQFYGDRSGTLVDPFGHTWTIATHIEDVSNDEIERRMAKMKK